MQRLQQLCNSCASLAGLVLCFVACFILLVIAPLPWPRWIMEFGKKSKFIGGGRYIGGWGQGYQCSILLGKCVYQLQIVYEIYGFWGFRPSPGWASVPLALVPTLPPNSWAYALRKNITLYLQPLSRYSAPTHVNEHIDEHTGTYTNERTNRPTDQQTRRIAIPSGGRNYENLSLCVSKWTV